MGGAGQVLERPLEKIEKDLRENLFGQRAWNALDPTTRTFIASGERMFRANIRDQMFDLGLTLLEFAKALEVRCNTLLRMALAGAPPAVKRPAAERASSPRTARTSTIAYPPSSVATW